MNNLRIKLMKLLRYIVYGYKVDSAHYVAKMRKLGMRIGERTIVFEPNMVF